MSQYRKIKNEHPGYIVLFRMGDFYEIFFEDAVTASQAVDITLTKRGKVGKDPIPMAGVPYHSLDTYLERFVKRGHRVAVCEQVFKMDEKGTPKIVGREVKRLVTPGTLTEDSFLKPREHNYILSVYPTDTKAERIGLAWMDLSTGEFFTSVSSAATLPSDLARLSPTEVVIQEDNEVLKPILMDYALSRPTSNYFDAKQAKVQLRKMWGKKIDEVEDDLAEEEKVASSALLQWVSYTQQGNVGKIQLPRRYNADSVMHIDAATRRSLEITKTLSGERRGSLLWVMDKTITGPGGRLLDSRLNAPLTQMPEIQERLDVVEHFIKHKELIEKIRSGLKKCTDVERCMQKLSLGRGGPRDLAAVASTLAEAEALRVLLPIKDKKLPKGLKELSTDMQIDNKITETLAKALNTDNLPQTAADGGFVRMGYSDPLDKQVILRDNSHGLLMGVQTKYRNETGISTLKIRHNGVIGFFVEVSATHGDTMEMNPKFFHHQTLSGVKRYKTKELGELETRINQAGNTVKIMELKIFAELAEMVSNHANVIHQISRSLASLDVSTALATLAIERKYTRPSFVDSTDYKIVAGRHPIVEMMRLEQGESFATNDANLGPSKKMWLVTGPNMGGKSTFLRQNALLSVMAQMGSFVPADKATIGVVDQLFCRVGAADDLAHNMSTFMVEMIETANILKRASPKSLVIMDEIGRGTATQDGLSIAWAVMEYLYEKIKCRVLFATHFHELSHLKNQFPNLHCATMDVIEKEGELIFTHRIVDGVATHSYGIPCAKLAGLPVEVTDRATVLLKGLQKKAHLLNLSKISEVA